MLGNRSEGRGGRVCDSSLLLLLYCIYRLVHGGNVQTTDQNFAKRSTIREGIGVPCSAGLSNASKCHGSSSTSRPVLAADVCMYSNIAPSLPFALVPLAA